MIELNLLFTDNNNANLSSDYFTDMGLECLKITLTENEYKMFVDTISRPLISVDMIKERQNILRDFLTHPHLLTELQKICSEAQNNRLTVSDYKGSSKKKLIEYLQVTNKSLEVPVEFLKIMQYKVFSSKTLTDFCKQLSRVDLLNEIKTKIDEIIGWLMRDCVTFDIEYGSGFKLKNSHVASEGSDFVQAKTRFGRQKKDFPNAFEFLYNLDFILDLQINNLINCGVTNMCSIINAINSHILSFCKELTRQLLFYSAAIKIINFSYQIGCSITFPQFQSKTISAKVLYDFSLLFTDFSLKGKVPNDFIETENAFYLISGVNQGGKTTFIKSIGIAQLFAQNGLPVFSEKYDSPVYKNFVSHFQKEEDTTLSHGKLAEELTRFHDTLPLIKDNALVLLNESFATTTEKEGYEIAFDVLRALSKACPLLFFVTHNFKLLKGINELNKMLFNDVQLYSLIASAGNTSTNRTYTIIPGEPQQELYGLEYVLQRIK